MSCCIRPPWPDASAPWATLPAVRGFHRRQRPECLADTAVGPTHRDLSPYQSLSAHAGNPAFIDVSELATLGLLRPEELDELEQQGRQPLLRRAATRFSRGEGRLGREDYDRFCRSHRRWLEDFVLFSALRERHPGSSWLQWPEPYRHRDPAALKAFSEANRDLLEAICFEQYLFHHQWRDIRDYARARGVLLFGDIPIFAAHDSADVWANRHLFKLDAHGPAHRGGRGSARLLLAGRPALGQSAV